MNAEGDALQLEVTDFGPIVEAKVDLRPLTVFIGPSHTGKSYLATLIYALHRIFGCGTHHPAERFRKELLIRRLRPGVRERELSEAEMAALLSLPRSGDFALPDPVAGALRSRIDDMAHALTGEIARCFGVENYRALIRRGRGNIARVVMRRPVPGASGMTEHEIHMGPGSKFRSVVPAGARFPKRVKTGRIRRRVSPSLVEKENSAFVRHEAALDVLGWIGARMTPSLFGPLGLPAWYLPADRMAMMRARRAVVGSLVVKLSAANLPRTLLNPLVTGVLADFLEQLVEIDDEPVRRRPKPAQRSMQALGKTFERALLDGGSIRVKRSLSGRPPDFVYRPDGWKRDLELAHTSAKIPELAPVALYLRYLLEPGHVLILEEPEAHLTPETQVELTRQLAALVNAGVRVILTTHSEWMMETLSNIVRRSELSRAHRRGAIALPAEQVGVWRFEPTEQPQGSVVREVRLDEDGVYPAGYDKVAMALHNEWAGITSRIENGP